MQPIIGITSGWEKDQVVRGWSLNYVNHECIQAIERAGGIPLILPVVDNSGLRERLVKMLNGLIVSGEVLSIKTNVLANDRPKGLGAQNPKRYANERNYLELALKRELPILAICRGFQVMAEALGGEFYQDDITLMSNVPHHQGSHSPAETSHQITILEGTVLAKTVGVGTMAVNSFHRQAVLKPPLGFRVAATSSDGVVEAMESIEHQFQVGIQFHPEMLPWVPWGRLFQCLVNCASQT